MSGLQYLEALGDYNETVFQMLGISYGMAAVVSIVAGVLQIIGMWNLFEKAGEAGIASIIPIYNMYVLFKIIYGNGWKFLLFFVPILNFFVGIAYNYRLARVFGKSTGFAVANVFLPSIFTLIIGLDKNATYRGAYYGLL